MEAFTDTLPMLCMGFNWSHTHVEKRMRAPTVNTHANVHNNNNNKDL